MEIIANVYKMRGHTYFFFRTGTWVLCKDGSLLWSFREITSTPDRFRWRVDWAGGLKQALRHGFWLSESRRVHGPATSPNATCPRSSNKSESRPVHGRATSPNATCPRSSNKSESRRVHGQATSLKAAVSTVKQQVWLKAVRDMDKKRPKCSR